MNKWVEFDNAFINIRKISYIQKKAYNDSFGIVVVVDNVKFIEEYDNIGEMIKKFNKLKGEML